MNSFLPTVLADNALNQRSHYVFSKTGWFDESQFEKKVAYYATYSTNRRHGNIYLCTFYSNNGVSVWTEDSRGIDYHKNATYKCTRKDDERLSFTSSVDVIYVECKNGFVWRNSRADSSSFSKACIPTPCVGLTIYDSDAAQCQPLIEPKTLNKTLGFPNCGVGNPCDTATGNKFQAEVDFTSSTLSFIRYYNSLLNTNGIVGENWSHNYSSHLIIATDTVLVRSGSGKRLAFDHPAEGLTTSDPDTFSQLLKKTDGSWEYHRTDNTVEIYSANGQLVTIRTLNGLETHLSYYSNGSLKDVTNPYGQILSFAYNAEGKVGTVTTPVQEVIHYSYNGSRLETVTYPDSTTRQYLYNNNNAAQMNGIIDENGHPYARWDYDSQGRAILSEHLD